MRKPHDITGEMGCIFDLRNWFCSSEYFLALWELWILSFVNVEKLNNVAVFGAVSKENSDPNLLHPRPPAKPGFFPSAVGFEVRGVGTPPPPHRAPYPETSIVIYFSPLEVAPRKTLTGLVWISAAGLAAALILSFPVPNSVWKVCWLISPAPSAGHPEHIFL